MYRHLVTNKEALGILIGCRDPVQLFAVNYWSCWFPLPCVTSQVPDVHINKLEIPVFTEPRK